MKLTDHCHGNQKIEVDRISNNFSDPGCVCTEKFQSLCRKTLELCQNNETDPNQKPAFAKNIASFTTYDL